MRVFFCCACLAEVTVDGKMRRFDTLPLFEAFSLFKLKASVLGNTPVRHVL